MDVPTAAGYQLASFPMRVPRPVTEEVLSQIKGVFRHYATHSPPDPPHLTRATFKLATVALLGSRPSKQELDVYFPLPSPSGGSQEAVMEQDRFIKVMSDRLSIIDPDEEIRLMFRAFEVSGSGFLTLADVGTIFQTYAPAVSSVTIEQIFSEADRDGDGRVTYTDFERMLTAPEAATTTTSLRTASPFAVFR
ncbi:hypothetical protein PAPYR_5001 [Paratrimastix pyriformis]|uniref:EF-hand domain-containing protein n=1 Tax=Paratrimastix pyriformis TaxID=342808 RepID=A0ABQ8UR43_9EUKA|nr:hypothetical protein PAPYR_5001 [Paratrimastix pyriformis]